MDGYVRKRANFCFLLITHGPCFCVVCSTAVCFCARLNDCSAFIWNKWLPHPCSAPVAKQSLDT